MEYNSKNNTCACPDGQHQKEGTGDCVGQMKLDEEIQYDIILHLSKTLNNKHNSETTRPNRHIPLKLNKHDFHIDKYKELGHELTMDVIKTANQNDIFIMKNITQNIISIDDPTIIELPSNKELEILKQNFITKIQFMKKLSDKKGITSGQTDNAIFKTRQVFFGLYKLALNFIKTIVCNGEEDDCTHNYIQAVYDIFNITVNNIRIFDKLFNPFPINKENYNDRKKQLIKFFDFIGKNTMEKLADAYYNPKIKEIPWNNVIGDGNEDGIINLVPPPPAVAALGGSRPNISVGPDDIPKVLAQQVAWENMNKEYSELEPEYQQMIPEPEPAPIHSLTEPIHRFIDEFADEDPLEEARESVGLLAPHEIDDLMANDKGVMDRIKPLYAKAIPSAKDEWIPILVRADSLRTLL
jgi:hypothetical protein